MGCGQADRNGIEREDYSAKSARRRAVAARGGILARGQNGIENAGRDRRPRCGDGGFERTLPARRRREPIHGATVSRSPPANVGAKPPEIFAPGRATATRCLGLVPSEANPVFQGGTRTVPWSAQGAQRIRSRFWLRLRLSRGIGCAEPRPFSPRHEYRLRSAASQARAGRILQWDATLPVKRVWIAVV
jgi:hypothetical protein